jgi:hypothetical protein
MSSQFIFTDEHEQLRESLRAFVRRELRPHLEKWERETFPDSISAGSASLDFSGLTSLKSTADRAETISPLSCSRRSCGAAPMPAWRWVSPCIPT